MSAHDALDHDQGGLLSDATLATLQLHQQPFAVEAQHAGATDQVGDDGDDQSFIDTITEEQLADIKQAIITGDDLLLILGEKGAGKTTLLQQLNTHSGLRIQCFAVTGSERFSTVNLFSGMLEAFKIPPPEKLKDILDELIPCLQSMVARNTLSAIVLDDADKVSKTELTQLLSGMLYMNSQDETLMRVALAAPSSFEDLIPELLPEGADLPYSSLTIEGFSPQRAAAYLDHRLALAGFDKEFPFTERDMASLVDHSGGRPAELHALTADVLNEKYGKLEASMPTELISEEGAGFLQTRIGKLALGALATLLIIGGLLMFLPANKAPDPAPMPERTNVAESAEQTQLEVPEPTVVAPEEPQAPVENEQRVSVGQTTDSPAITAGEDTAQAASSSDEGTSEPSSNEPDTATQAESTAPESARTADSIQPVEQSVDQPIEEAASGDTAENETAASTGELASSENSTPPADDGDPQDANSNADDTDRSAANSTPAASTEGQAASAEPAPETTVEQAEVAAQPSTEAVDETPEPASVVNVDDELAALLESPTWILVQDESLYTVQMSASRDLASVQNFLRRNPLSGPNSIFSFERDGDVWFALVHGIFPTIADAQRAVEQMSDDARRDEPWIRSIAILKQILREP